MKHLCTLFMGLFSALMYSQDIELESFASGFNDPVNIKNAGDGRLFVVEQAGLIQIINANGDRNATPFLNINSIVIDGGGERGLLGLAFHPNYASNGYFYLNYINNSGNTIISRFTRSTSDPAVADVTSELQLLTYNQPFVNHNGGDMTFGTDGYLYISSGDGGSAGDPGDRAQSLTTFLGKILRIDVDNTDNDTNYTIPPDNPFISVPNALPEIWAYGLRNPWKFSFDKTTNDLWVADVGQYLFEEINMVGPNTAGVNYGWRCYEGNSTFDQTGNCPPDNTLTFPIAQYSHNNDGLSKCSITGGFRYRGTAQPNFSGLYFFADFCSGEIGILQQSGDLWNLTFSASFPDNGWTTFGEDVNGEIYIAGNISGTVYRIIDATLGIDENDEWTLKMYPNPVKDQMTIMFSNPAILIESINIYNLQGKLMSTSSDFQQQLFTVSTKNLAKGFYFVEIITSEGATKIKKFIKG